MSQPESRLQRRIQKALKKAFPVSWWVKFWGGPFTMAGVPDLIGCVNGRFFGIEVKLPKRSSKTSTVQDETIIDIRHAGGSSTVVRSPEEAVVFVRAQLGGDPVDVIRAIANGHNNPRRLAQDFLDGFIDQT